MCVAGGVYPFVAQVVSGNCELKPTMGKSVLCWEVYGSEGEKCTIRVVDKNNNSTEYSLTVLGAGEQLPVETNPALGGEISSGSGAGGCNSGSSELGLLSLMAILGKGARKLARKLKGKKKFKI